MPVSTSSARFAAADGQAPTVERLGTSYQRSSATLTSIFTGAGGWADGDDVEWTVVVTG